MPGNPYQAEFTLYPDPDANGRYTPRGGYISEQMSRKGVSVILNMTREQLKKEPIREWISIVRFLFEEGYGPATRYGEAFEDGALAGLLIASRTLDKRTMPILTDKVGAFIEACEGEYYGHARAGDAAVRFSEPRKEFINAIRSEGMKGNMAFHPHISPLSAQITIAKYEPDPEYVETVSQGIGFILNQMKWAHDDDFMKFADRYEAAQATHAGRQNLTNHLAHQAMEYLSLQPRSQP